MKAKGTAQLPAPPHTLEDIEITGFGERIARCSCGVRSGRWSEPRLAVAEWERHHEAATGRPPSQMRRRHHKSPDRSLAVSGELDSPSGSPHLRHK